MSKKTKILVCCHKKEDFIWNNDVYMPIHCGAALSPEQLDMQRDDTGDNISYKNKNYCELTGLYWAWKNLESETEYVGLCHYRRYFDFRRKFFKKHTEIITTEAFRKMPIQMPDFEKIFSKYDVVIQKPKIRQFILKDFYSIVSVSCVDFDILENIISDLTPDYMDAYNRVMKYNNHDSIYNMFIAKRSVFDGYGEWLFKILGEVEKKVNLSHYPFFRARIFGFMGEFLLQVYIEKHRLKVGYAPILWVTDEKKQANLFLYFLRRMRNSIAFKLRYPKQVFRKGTFLQK